jgi:hypothetical protein
VCVREYEVLGRREIDSRYVPAGGVQRRFEKLKEFCTMCLSVTRGKRRNNNTLDINLKIMTFKYAPKNTARRPSFYSHYLQYILQQGSLLNLVRRGSELA